MSSSPLDFNEMVGIVPLTSQWVLMFNVITFTSVPRVSGQRQNFHIFASQCVMEVQTFSSNSRRLSKVLH